MGGERELLMIPGPTNVDPSVLRAMSKPTVSHVSQGFARVHGEAVESLRRVFMTEGMAFILPGSGTLAMEVAVANAVEQGDRVLVVCNGHFSERFALICERHGAAVDRLEVEWGRAADPETVRGRLEGGGYKALLVVHAETSTAAANNIRGIGEVAKDFGVLYIVDTVASLAGMEVRVDEWHIDICASASQKAVAAPPGLALLAASERTLQALEERRRPVDFFYGDLKNWIPKMKDATKYFATVAVNNVYGLHQALSMVLEEGLERRWERHRLVAGSFRNAVEALGLSLVPEKGCAADTLTAVYLPEGVDDARFRSTLSTKYRVVVAGGLGRFAGRIFRVGHMGNVSPSDITATIAAIEMTLPELGYPVKRGMGVAAALGTLGNP